MTGSEPRRAFTRERSSAPPAPVAGRARRASVAGPVAMALGALCGIAICALGLTLLMAARRAATPPPLPTAQAVCASLEHQQYGTFYDLLAPAEQAAGTSAQFAASQRQLDIVRGAVTRCAATAAGAGQSTQLSATLTLTRAQAGMLRGQVRLTLVGGVWRVASYDTSVI